LRLARLRNTRLTPLRSCACSTAASTAVRCTAENASAVSVTSLVLVPRLSGGASIATSTSAPARSRLTTFGSRSSASVRAAPRSPVSSRLIRLPNPSSRTEETMTASSPAPPTRITLRMMASLACACPLVMAPLVAVSAPVSLAKTVSTPASQAVGLTGSAAPGRPATILFSSACRFLKAGEASTGAYGLGLSCQSIGASPIASRSRWSSTVCTNNVCSAVDMTPPPASTPPTSEASWPMSSAASPSWSTACASLYSAIDPSGLLNPPAYWSTEFPSVV